MFFFTIIRITSGEVASAGFKRRTIKIQSFVDFQKLLKQNERETEIKLKINKNSENLEDECISYFLKVYFSYS